MRRAMVVVATVVLMGAISAVGAAARTNPEPARRSPDLFNPYVEVLPEAGPAGVSIRIRGEANSNACVSVIVTFTDAAGQTTTLGHAYLFDFKFHAGIPRYSAVGAGSIIAANQMHFDPRGPHGNCAPGGGTFGSATFTVTSPHEGPRSAQVQVRPSSGPAGTTIRVRGRGFVAGNCYGNLYFTDAARSMTWLGTFTAADGSFRTTAVIPGGANPGTGSVVAEQRLYDTYPHSCGRQGPSGSATFTVAPRL